MELRLLLLLLVSCHMAMGRFGIPYLKYATAEDFSTGSKTCDDPADEDQFRCIDGGCKSSRDPDNDRCYGSCTPLEWKCDGTNDCSDYSDELQDTCNTNCRFS